MLSLAVAKAMDDENFAAAVTPVGSLTKKVAAIVNK